MLAGGRYRLERELGRGGMATVHLGHDVELGRPVAVKILAAQLAGDEELRARFVREARLAARLSHPNIVQVFDAGEDDGLPYIVMEHVPGATLAEELRRSGRLPAGRTVDLGLQVCAGLEHAHAAGLVHRDVKPQNLILRDDGVVKIADFGIARAAETTQLTQTGSVLGTAAYLAPEQAAGERVTAAADIYSLGVVLYELLTGKTPYAFESLAELVDKQRHAPVRPIRGLARDVPEGLEETIMRCLARNPSYRPASAAELARELTGAAPEPPTMPLPERSVVRASEVTTGPLPRERPEPQRGPRRTSAAVVAALGLALVAAAVGIWAGGADLGGGRSGSKTKPGTTTVSVPPVPPSDDPAVQARNLSDWLRDRAG
jgi:eukaryotic-like serine/threonine-protein kinase